MQFSHATDIWAEFPELAVGVAATTGIDASDGAARAVAARMPGFYAIADARLAECSETELPETQGWRRAYARMGLKPTQYRCASEALLRRYKRERSVPAIHPLVDLCNAVSLAFAIPIAVFDLDQVSGSLQVRHADGSESYLAFSGEREQPYPSEVIFADDAGQVHARRWTNRQSALSAVSSGTSRVLIVAEAMHESAAADIEALMATIAAELAAAWPAPVRTQILRADEPLFRPRLTDGDTAQPASG